MFGREQFQEVRSYLESSKKNFLIITDFLVHECMQGNAIRNFVSDFEQLVPYVEQLIVLKPTFSILRLRPRSEGLHQRLFCHEQTNILKHYLANTVSNIKSSGPTERFQQFANSSQLKFNLLLERADEMYLLLDGLIESFPKEELRKIRSGGDISRQFADHLFEKVAEFAMTTFPEGMRLPNMPHVLYSFPYRYAIAYVNLALDWRLNSGGIKNAKPEVVRNDAIDLTYVTYSTFFDGLLSNDGRVLRVSRETNKWLRVFISVLKK